MDASSSEERIIAYEKEKINLNAVVYRQYGKPFFPRWLLNIVVDWLVIFVAYYGVYWAYVQTKDFHYQIIFLLVAVFVAIFIIGNRQHALSIMGHDGAHRLAARNKTFNDWATNLLTFWPLGAGLLPYRIFHLDHHRLLGTEEDPEYQKKSTEDPIFDIPKTKRQIIRRFLFGLVGFHGGWKGLFDIILAFNPRKGVEFWGLWIWRIIAITILYWLNVWWWVLPLWFVAIGTSFWSIFNLRIWIEHIGTSDVHRVRASLWQRLVFLPHYTWLHWEHHRWDFIPFFNLPKVREIDNSVKIVPVRKLLASYEFYPYCRTGKVTKRPH